MISDRKFTMLKISVYHWLPLADNILPEIVANLKNLPEADSVQNVNLESEYLSYNFKILVQEEPRTRISIFGNINSRSFSQYVFQIPSIPGHSLRDTLARYILNIRDKIASHILTIVTRPVQNKLAVLTEGIVSFNEFEATTFDLLIEGAAKKFLIENHITVIQVDSGHKDDVRSGISIPKIQLELEIGNIFTHRTEDETHLTSVSWDSKTFIFYSETGHFIEDDGRFDNAFFKYAAVLLLELVTARNLKILKLVKDHVIPVRRVLVGALQRNTEDHFGTLTLMKKYLTYVNIKLPVMEKVLGYIKLTIKTHPELYNGVKQTFNVANLNEFHNLAIIARDLPHLDPNMVIKKIEVDFNRLGELFEENEKEIEVLSNEVSQVLQGNLLAQNSQILDRELETSQAILELDRGGKNRSNALKVLSIILSANIGVAFGGEVAVILGLNEFIGIFKIVGAALTVFIAWIYIEKFIADKAGHFRLVIPIKAEVPGSSLTKLTHSHKLWKMDSSGPRRRRSWIEKFETEDMRVLINSNYKLIRKNPPRKFEVTIDYEKRGLIHSIMLETESRNIQFSSCHLVTQVFKSLNEYGCLDNLQNKETSLLVEALSHLNVLIELRLPAEQEARDSNMPLVALNRLLTMSSAELRNILQIFKMDPDDTTLSQDDRILFKDVFDRKDLYNRWFDDIERNKAKEVEYSLIGIENVSKKKDILQEYVRK